MGTAFYHHKHIISHFVDLMASTSLFRKTPPSLSPPANRQVIPIAQPGAVFRWNRAAVNRRRGEHFSWAKAPRTGSLRPVRTKAKAVFPLAMGISRRQQPGRPLRRLRRGPGRVQDAQPRRRRARPVVDYRTALLLIQADVKADRLIADPL